MTVLDYLWGLGLLASLAAAGVIFFIRWTWMSMKPSASHAIGLGFLALACLALLSILAVEYGGMR